MIVSHVHIKFNRRKFVIEYPVNESTRVSKINDRLACAGAIAASQSATPCRRREIFHRIFLVAYAKPSCSLNFILESVTVTRLSEQRHDFNRRVCLWTILNW